MIEAEEDNYPILMQIQMTGYFLYFKAKTRGSNLHVTKNKISKTKHINKEFKTI